jgi:cytochrome c oxidase cbb3-type subunit 3
MSDESRQDQILDHNYDGIQEYDNPLPRWWLYLFYGSIVFSAVYALYFHFGPGLLAVDSYNKSMIAYYEKQAEELAAMGEITEETLTNAMDNPSMMAGAQQIFQSKCVQCHGVYGEGNIGPNLTDNYWIHGPLLTDIYRIVHDGVVAKGMLAWKNQLRPAELIAVSAYVGTLRGSAPANPKAPQGDLHPYDPGAALAAPDESGGEPEEIVEEEG